MDIDDEKDLEENQIEENEIEVVSGDGSEIEISPVYEHLNALKPKIADEKDKKKQIIIPEVKKKIDKIDKKD